ncbi:MAG: alanine racemase [Pyrinomonadaceae bacterium]
MRPTAAIIDLDNLAANLRAMKDFVGPTVKYMAVVKANAYGHGAVPCALRLESEGVDWFCVAIPEEGIELRNGGITKPILCLGTFWPGQEKLAFDHDLTPVVFNEDEAFRLNSLAATTGKILDIHVKVDTGMGRVGVRPDVWGQFAATLAGLKHLNIDGLMTHFAAAENPVENAFTELQIERFDSACDIFHAAGHSPKWIDLANSPAAIRHPYSRGNLVRLGGALYGLLDDILPENIDRPALKPVLSLRSLIADIKLIEAGETLGYGRTFTTERASHIALVPIGYADGYPRALSNQGKAEVNDAIVPIVGRISMDWILLDVTDTAGTKIGDEVTLIGPGIKATDIASLVGTIGYEITCGLTARVPRIYQ